MVAIRAGEKAAGPAAARGDDRLLRDFLAGDAAAVRRVERWAWEIVYFRWRALGEDERDDIVQDTLAGLLEACRRPAFELQVSLRALVRRIAAARCIDRVRRRRPQVDLSETLADPAPAPDEAWRHLDERERLRWVLRELPAFCRDLIRQRFLDERPYADIAAELGRAEATLRVHLFNCLKTVRRLWERTPA
jgi:RNA polymerase sigma factor (sigma-70 family)